MIYSFEHIVLYHDFMIDLANFVVFALVFDFDKRSELYIILIVLMQRTQIYIYERNQSLI